MGAWSYGIFDDDTAYDFFSEIEADAKGFFQKSFEHAIQTDYLEYDEAHAVNVSAAYLDNYLNGTTYRTDSEEDQDISNVNLFRTLKPNLQLAELKPLAVQALQKVMSNTSELNELWSENEELYPKWKANLENLIVRLS